MSVSARSFFDYDRLPPRAALRGVVESIWVQDAAPSDEPPKTHVVPTGTVEILFHYGDPFVHLEGAERHAVPRSYITGQRTRAVIPDSTGTTGIVIASLYPWALGRLFGGAAPEMTDGYLDLRQVVSPAVVREMEDRLQRATKETRIELLQLFLLNLLQGTSANVRVEVAARHLAVASGLPRMDRLALELGLSERHFRRLFHSQVGISPKLFHRIMRFQRVMDFRTTTMPWSQVAATCGYADQAHLIREVVAFSGRTPGQLAKLRSHADEAFNGSEVSEFFNAVYL